MKLLRISLILLITTLITCCEEEETCFRCVFEQRKTDGCDGYGFGEWEDKEYHYDTEEIKDGWSRQDVCDAIKSGPHCAASCCINYQIRNMQVANCN